MTPRMIRLAAIAIGLLVIASVSMWISPGTISDWQRAGADGLKSATERLGLSKAASKEPRSADGRLQRFPVETSVSRLAMTSTDIRAVGSLQSDEAVAVAPEIAGRISEILFTEGQPVKAGDVIAKLDSSLITAEITDADARLKLAEANFDRAKTLAKTGSATERSRDEATFALESAKAALELAKTRLDKHTVRAPFNGIAGVRSISVGAFVTAGTRIVNIEKIDRIKVDFKVPQRYLQRIALGQTVAIEVDALTGRTFEGQIYAIDPLIDVNGRALQIRARLENADLALRPGLFARVVIKGLAEREVVLIPESAIVPRSGESYVFKVEGGRAIERRVKLGERHDAEVEIVEGIEAGATIVVAGQQQLRNGAEVDVVTPKIDAVSPTSGTSMAPAAQDRS
ncbi:MAG: efflux RND transporter periplasmic adaptor subunit [Hyphomicrobium sp.]|nr:efflux RND transporter periplasmic adaptor subunit [Hyphomicrobium sp.]